MSSSITACACGSAHTAESASEKNTLIPNAFTREILDCRHELSCDACVSSERANISGHIHGQENCDQAGRCSHAAATSEPVAFPEKVIAGSTAVTLFSVNGMCCPVEERLVRNRLTGMSGVLALEFNLMQRTLKVRHESAALPAIEKALSSLNMDAKVMNASTGADNAISETRTGWKKLAVAGLFATLSEVFELLREWDAGPSWLSLQNWRINGVGIVEWLPIIFAAIAILAVGPTTYKKGWIALKNRDLNINALMSVAVTGAVFIGQHPEAAMVMVLFTIAEAIEDKALDRARNAVKNLLALAPERATVRQTDGTWLEMDIRQVAVGSRVRVRPGEKVALDGIVVRGQSAVNQAPITGESLPVEKNVGDAVYAGTINESGSFELDVTTGASNSTLARIIHAVEKAQGTRAPIQRFVDLFAAYYTPGVFLIAVLTALIPPLFMGGAWIASVYTALVLLVISCPCALVISTPVSIVSGLAGAARNGILIKGGVFLEQGRLLSRLALDKTGTITHGKPRQTDFTTVGEFDGDEAFSLAAGIAARSDHPVSKAIAEAALEAGLSPAAVDDFAAIPGQGVSGVVEGQKWFLGNHRMVEDLQLCAPALEDLIFAMEKQGKTVVALIGERGVQALFAVADTLKDSSVEAIEDMKRLGIETIMLTGDNEHTARAIAEQVGVNAFKSNLLPEDKLAAVEELARRGKVGMVGDGINDAPALARADIGFAMAINGTDTAIKTADVALMDDDLRKIPRFIRLSRATYAILMQNIALALGIKTVFLALTFMGQVTMWMAVFADMGTSLLVVANGLRAMGRKTHK
ncbi:MAG: heavy metal translocating P-type ATPase [Desulfovibrio sp.]|jgi:Cd2+/Zn2+-exporting ATPase|nr:heavy metal translocating P-type ATPase [Desulfovibrio sp.]